MVHRKELPNIAGDRLNVLLLTSLFVVQNIPRCMSDAIALILRKRNVSYTDQAEFSLVGSPICFNVLWAPIVDCVYSKRVGRRKSWIIPVQYLMGICLLYTSMNFDGWLETSEPQTRTLGFIFFMGVLLASTQCIAAVGWSLTMLKKRNVGHASMCENVGYAVSQFVGFVLFLGLESADICNKFRSVPRDHGFVSFSDFILLWAIVFIVSTTLIIFKEEVGLTANEDDHQHDHRLGLKESYTHLWQIIKIAPVGLGPMNGVSRLKLIDAGVPSDTFALMTAPSLPFLVLVPFALSRFLVGHSAMRTFVIIYVLKLIVGIVYTVFIFFTPFFKNERNELPDWHGWVVLVISNASIFIEHLMFIAIGAFFSRISDPQFGGMYLTLFNCIANIGYRWPISVSLWLVDFFAIRSCSENKATGLVECIVILDGFFVEVIAGSVIAVLWLYWAKRKIYELEDMDVSEWIVKTKSIENKTNEKY